LTIITTKAKGRLFYTSEMNPKVVIKILQGSASALYTVPVVYSHQLQIPIVGYNVRKIMTYYAWQ